MGNRYMATLVTMRLGADVLVFFHCNGSDQRGSFWILHCCREMMSAVMRVPYGTTLTFSMCNPFIVSFYTCCCFKKYLVKLTMRLHEVCNTRKDVIIEGQNII
ncbi:uncharacterized protein LOC103502561 isoform X6 [Cucumis melo]|nr:uncharacterized protein LOC103502561 isoform X6 [Cucumis melo]